MCNQKRRMAFCESVWSFGFYGIFWASNGTNSFSLWHLWKNKLAIALWGEQEEEKWKHLNGNMPSGFDCSSVVYMQKRLEFLENKARESTSRVVTDNRLYKQKLSHLDSSKQS
ncbi:hypothetical protein YC2023_063641 [Brassica napus]|uniref:(rape) hypothetical protein n=1 Tax=Brassica napus TaxID=3708 RepID=A0A816NNC2_BRANA|nr:unnamed protein product [Brassica napus]